MSQVVGISVAIGATAGARRLAPETMRNFAKTLERVSKAVCRQDSAEYIRRQSNRTADYAVMFGAGFMSALGTQITLARKRRNSREVDGDITIQRDAARVMAGWGVGFFGCLASVAVADRYFRAGSAHTISPLLTNAEKWLDSNLFGGVEFAEGRKLSEALVANLAMLPGGAPASIIGQRLYDAALVHPAYQKDH